MLSCDFWPPSLVRRTDLLAELLLNLNTLLISLSGFPSQWYSYSAFFASAKAIFLLSPSPHYIGVFIAFTRG